MTNLQECSGQVAARMEKSGALHTDAHTSSRNESSITGRGGYDHAPAMDECRVKASGSKAQDANGWVVGNHPKVQHVSQCET